MEEADDWWPGVTGDGRRDFLVLNQGGSSIPGMVASDDDGAWRLLPDQRGGTYFWPLHVG